MESRVLSRKRRRIELDTSGFVILRIQNPPSLKSDSIRLKSDFIHLKSDSLYTIGRCNRHCDFVCNDSRISNRHCQILFDSIENKLFVIDGFVENCYSSSEIGDFFRIRKCCNKEGFTRASTNGVFVNGVRVTKGGVFELFVGDSVSFVKTRVKSEPSFGFLVEKIVRKEDVLGCNQIGYSGGSSSNSKWLQGECRKTVVGGFGFGGRRRNEHLIDRAVFLLNQCRETLHSVDPVSHLRRCCMLLNKERKMARIQNGHSAAVCGSGDGRVGSTDVVGGGLRCGSVKAVSGENDIDLSSKTDMKVPGASSGKKFYLNRVKFMDHDNQHEVVSLPELLHPVATLSRMFIATFTNDVLWFLSYCEVPNHLPITIACHNTERCWSSDLDKRTSTPYPEYPNLVLVYPPFPEVIAFGKDRKRQGIACHHPKLLVLQREDSIRIVVTSANLVSKQWNDVTNTVWWQDFPRRNEPDYSSLFTHFTDGDVGFKSDFAAQLAGFVASLISDVPSQGQWIAELTKYDFSGAVGHLVASVPGMHKHNNPFPLEPVNFLSNQAEHRSSWSISTKFLGSVEASVVGLKHRFHTSADSNGAQLKTLAAFLRRCRENVFGMSEVVLRRNTKIPADSNAVSVLICDLDEASEGDYIQLGFLPRNIANWVAPLCDAGLFSFTACIYPKEALAAALEGSNSKVQLILYVAQGPNFHEISTMIKPAHVAAICSLLASVQRCSGIWRLREVLDQYKWPELLETDFIYGSSSIGTSIDPKFLAAFSAAAGKKSLQYPDSEESDPEWGIWNANQEARNPSMRILFPTIQRVKAAPCGIWPSRRLLCFSEKTWQRLRTVDMLRDSVPHPKCRVGYPMHVKVARRRFKSKTGKSSFGWVYCGSHNFSPAAWGRPVAAPSVERTDKSAGTTSCPSSRLHICNYELGIVFVVPPSDKNSKSTDLDDIVLPFVVPAPKYRQCDRPATAQAMREALAELGELEKKILESQAGEEAEEMMAMMEEGIPEEEELVELTTYVSEEKDEEKAYAETLWVQVDSSEG
ncbi:hypothetical protein MKW94_028766 [Papaver nudicaule]|uniref:FHA domain-containing protein n=1 Tax=Papaver nudicaule TaxID=74823 RepID=A0AA42B171_PAPNU|nr:hypothetical protein [Papaver nudicaule]